MKFLSRQDIGNQLRKLREQTGLTQKQVSEILHRNQQSVNHWESGYSQPNIETLICLLEIYGIDSIFVPNQRYHRNLSDEEMRLLSNFKKAPYAIQEAAKRLLTVDEEMSETPASSSRIIPVYQMPTDRVKMSSFLDGDNFELVEVDGTIPYAATFGVILVDDSMYPMADKEQTVWVRRQKTLEHGDVGLFIYNETIMVRRLWKQLDKTSLLSVNDKYAPIYVELDDSIKILGKILS